MTSRKRLAWLLWFALLLPFAQLAAAAHEIGHWTQPAAAAKPQAPAHGTACDVCAAASVAGGGALLAAPAVLPPSLPAAAPAIACAAAAPDAAPARFFTARAPPPA